MKRRIEQLNELIKHEISNLLLREMDFPKGCIVTVTRVKCSADLRYAKIFVSVLPSKLEKKILNILKNNTSHLRFLLGKKLTIKFIPQINFVLDVQEKKAEEVEQLIKKIQKET